MTALRSASVATDLSSTTERPALPRAEPREALVHVEPETALWASARSGDRNVESGQTLGDQPLDLRLTQAEVLRKLRKRQERRSQRRVVSGRGGGGGEVCG